MAAKLGYSEGENSLIDDKAGGENAQDGRPGGELAGWHL